jgi:hypothetical protein
VQQRCACTTSAASAEPQWDSIPNELKDHAPWMLRTHEFRNGRWKKMLHQPNGTRASSTSPATWAPIEFVQAGARDIGFQTYAHGSILEIKKI